jgi:hypothetical protein
MGFFDLVGDIVDAIWTGIVGIWHMAVKVVKACVKFLADIFNWLQDLLDDSAEEVIPFAANFDKLISQAPHKDVGLKRGRKNIGAGLYNPSTKKIEKLKHIASDSIDNKTKEVLGEDALVILED